MKKPLVVLFIIFLWLSPHVFSQKGIVVEGTIMDAKEEYALLAYTPRMRGNLNFDGFKSIGAPVNEAGIFRLESKHITHGANYRLFFPKHYVGLILFEGDRIHLDIHLNDPKLTFATGRGAGKINVLSLPQFQYDYFDLETERTLTEYVDYTSGVIEDRLRLLQAIYSQELKNSHIISASNKDRIQKIITHSPLSQEEFKFLSTRVTFEQYSLISNFMAKKSGQDQSDTLSLDLNSISFRHVNKKAYSSLEHINDWSLYNALENVLQIEYLRNQQTEEGLAITYGNWRDKLRSDAYPQWCSGYLKQNFKQEVFNKYYAEYATGLMTWGMDYGSWLNYLMLNEDSKYVNRAQNFVQLLDHGLKNDVYRLDQQARNLDEKKFKRLLNSYKNSPLFIVFWSAQAAGASLIDELPSLKAFEKNFQDKIEVVYICVDKKENKNLWAARIIDESWQANHYFLPTEENKTTLNRITDSDISSLCSGGASYSFIDKDGEIKKEIGGPFYLGEKAKEELYK